MAEENVTPQPNQDLVRATTEALDSLLQGHQELGEVRVVRLTEGLYSVLIWEHGIGEPATFYIPEQ